MTPFSKQTLDFLFENRLNDSKLWFEEHKDQYRKLVLEPLHDLAEELAPAMRAIDPQFVTEPRVDKTICRIRRDTRFSRDKSLYRDNMWIIFKRGKMHGTEVPGIYFEISQHGFEYGCGFYKASPAYLQALRGRVLKQDPLFLAANEMLCRQNTFQIIGDCYKRPHFPNESPELRQWLERRELCITAFSKDYSLLFSDQLAVRLKEDLSRLAPVYRFLLQTALEQE